MAPNVRLRVWRPPVNGLSCLNLRTACRFQVENPNHC
jgi:hypothetical protein